jgi:hypothetical protein
MQVIKGTFSSKISVVSDIRGRDSVLTAMFSSFDAGASLLGSGVLVELHAKPPCTVTASLLEVKHL